MYSRLLSGWPTRLPTIAIIASRAAVRSAAGYRSSIEPRRRRRVRRRDLARRYAARRPARAAARRPRGSSRRTAGRSRRRAPDRTSRRSRGRARRTPHSSRAPADGPRARAARARRCAAPPATRPPSASDSHSPTITSSASGSGDSARQERRDQLGDVARVRDREHVARELRPLALDVCAIEAPQLALAAAGRAGSAPSTSSCSAPANRRWLLRAPRATAATRPCVAGVQHDEQIGLAQRRRLAGRRRAPSPCAIDQAKLDWRLVHRHAVAAHARAGASGS